MRAHSAAGQGCAASPARPWEPAPACRAPWQARSKAPCRSRPGQGLQASPALRAASRTPPSLGMHAAHALHAAHMHCPPLTCCPHSVRCHALPLRPPLTCCPHSVCCHTLSAPPAGIVCPSLGPNEPPPKGGPTKEKERGRRVEEKFGPLKEWRVAYSKAGAQVGAPGGGCGLVRVACPSRPHQGVRACMAQPWLAALAGPRPRATPPPPAPAHSPRR